MKIVRGFIVYILLAALSAGLPASAQTSAITERVSIASDGAQANGGSLGDTLSADGRYVAFTGVATNLVPGDTNGKPDVFVHDRQSGTTERVSVASDGAQANNISDFSKISADGRFVVFRSSATNLVPGDTNGKQDVFVHDRQNGTTERVSVASDGTQGNSNASSEPPVISADGRFVAFDSDSITLVPGDTNGKMDIFIRDRQTGTTELVSVASDGAQANEDSFYPFISADGRFVAFNSIATNLGTDDTNGKWDAYVHDRQTGTTERVSIANDGAQANDTSYAYSFSADGRVVGFFSLASNLVLDDTNGLADVFVHDRQSGTTEMVSVASDGAHGNSSSDYTSLSADGRFVAFGSASSNLVPDDTNSTADVFVRDRQSGTTERVNVAGDGSQSNDYSYDPVISADGRFVAFVSYAANLISNDTNAIQDVFVHYRKLTAPITLGSLNQTYNGTARPASATTTPAGLTVTYEYTGTGGTTYGPIATPPTNAGTYHVTATIDDAGYEGFVTGVLTIDKATAVITLGSLNQKYDGKPKTATAQTTPSGLELVFTYTGQAGTHYPTSSTPPIPSGRYSVTASVRDSNYSGTATGTLVVAFPEFLPVTIH